MSDLQKDLDQAKMQLKGLSAQLDAAKQMVNEGMNSNHILRSNLVLFQAEMKELAAKNEEHVRQIDALTKKIFELNPPKTENEVQPEALQA